MADWFSNLANQAKLLADSFVASANAAQDDFVAEQKKIVQEKKEKSRQSSSSIALPWETEDETLGILSQDVMERVLKLGLSERNFTLSPDELVDIEFSFKSYIPTALKLLSLDSNLSHMHSKLSPKMDEEIFWANYFRRTMYLRAVVGLDGEDNKEKYNKIPEESIIFAASFEADYQFRLDRLKDNNANDTTSTSLSKLTSNKDKGKGGYNEEEEKEDMEKLALALALAAEVEEELKDGGDIDLDDLEDLNLDDVDVEEYENIGNEDDDDFDDSEIEAQITRELDNANK